MKRTFYLLLFCLYSTFSMSQALEITGFDPMQNVVKLTAEGKPISQLSRKPVKELLKSNQVVLTKRTDMNQIPNFNGEQNTFFEFSFKVKNTSFEPMEELYYAIYYQNQTYKFDEGVFWVNPSSFDLENLSDNFYGSWGYEEDRSNGLRTIEKNGQKVALESGESAIVNGYFRIRGNPRNESKYANDEANYKKWNDAINSTQDWRLNRWKRPFRVGDYEFILIVTSDKRALPETLTDVTKSSKAGNFISPFVLLDKAKDFENTAIVKSDKKLNVIMRPVLTAAMDKNNLLQENYMHTWHDFRKIQPDYIMDLEKLTPARYKRFTRKFSRKDKTFNAKLDYNDGKAGNYRIEEDGLVFVSPGAVRNEEGVIENSREHAGVRMVPLQYGKYRAKVVFPKMNNQYGIWKGFNNTYWFTQITGSEQVHCESTGKELERHEVDIEFMPIRTRHLKNGYTPGNIKALCSNFDFSCDYGVEDYVNHKELKFDSYPHGDGLVSYERIGPESLTTAVIDDFDNKVFGKPYWYEIEWTPTEIFYRIGESPDKLQLIGYMDEKHTVIPNVPMNFIIAFHWLYHPPIEDVVHSHQFVPLNKNPIEGKILELIVD